MRAQQQQPIKCEFPNIPYEPHFVPLNDQRIPQHTYTFLKNNGMGYGLLDGINTMEALERKINDKIYIYIDGDDNLLFEIFCLIQIWGGRMGRIAFLQDIPFPDYWNKYLKDRYQKLACTCKSIAKKDNNLMGVDLEDIEKIYQTINSIRVNPNIRNLNVSFLTKHTRFWLQKNNFDNPLPIFDSIMSTGLFGKYQNISFFLLKQYWICMIEKARSIPGMTLLSLERQLFNYFLANKKNAQTKRINPTKTLIH